MKRLSFLLLIAFILVVSPASESSGNTMADYTSAPPASQTITDEKKFLSLPYKEEEIKPKQGGNQR